MFGWKLDSQGPSTMDGGKVEAATKCTMILDDHAAPFIPGGVVADMWPLGVMEGRCLGIGATAAFAALAESQHA